jgi:hypothetical protein
MAEDDVCFSLPWFFSDECVIELNPARTHAYSVPGITTARAIYQDYTKHRTHLITWSGIALNYKSLLVYVDGTMNGAKHMDMRTQNLVIDQLEQVHGPYKWVFQDDGARVTKEWESSWCLNVASKEFSGPDNRPDLNAVEHTWLIVKSGVDDAGIENEAQLFREGRRVWDSTPIAATNPAFESFANKLQGVRAVGRQSLNGHRKIMRDLR